MRLGESVGLGGVVRSGVSVGLTVACAFRCECEFGRWCVRSGVSVSSDSGVVRSGVVSEGTRCGILFIRLFVMVFEYIVIKKM